MRDEVYVYTIIQTNDRSTEHEHFSSINSRGPSGMSAVHWIVNFIQAFDWSAYGLNAAGDGISVVLSIHSPECGGRTDTFRRLAL